MMSLQGKIEAIVYAAEEPVTLDQLATLLKRDVLAELEAQATAAASVSAAEDGGAPTEGRSDAMLQQDLSEGAPIDGQPGVPPEALTETSTGSEEPSEARQQPERESEEPLSAPESTAASASAPESNET